MTILLSLIIFLALISMIFFGVGREKSWAFLFGEADLGAIDFEQFSASDKPNHALMCPEDYCKQAKADIISPVFDMPIAALQEKILHIIEAEAHLTTVASDDEEHEYRFVQHTPLMRFPDTIRLKLIEVDESSSTLALYSESQIGHSDLGVNQKRIKAWLDQLSSE